MIELVKACKIYTRKEEEPVTALSDISLSLPSAGLIFILGKSGSGKTTLLNLLGGLDSLSSGEMLFEGKSLRGFKPADYDVYRSSKVGFVFQDYSLLPQLDVAANIGISLELAGLEADPKRIEKALASVDLQHCTHAWGNELSGGQKQRVDIARALVKDPEVILADEPTGALDQENGTAVFQLLKRLSADRLVVIVSHDEEAAKTYADRIITLRDGKVVNGQELHPSPLFRQSPFRPPAAIRASFP